MIPWLKSIFFKPPKEIKNSSSNEDINSLVQQAFAYFESGALKEATVLFQKILIDSPNNHDALYFLGLIFKDEGEIESAISLINRAISIKKDEPEFYKSIGHIFLEAKRTKEAISAFESALKLDPQCVTSLTALIAAHRELGDMLTALAYANKILDIAPDCWPALNIRGEIFMHFGKSDLAISDFRKSMDLNPESQGAFRAYLFALNYSTEMSAAEIFAEHKRYDELHGIGKFKKQNITIKNPDPFRKLRVGYVSPDFFDHVVSFFIIPVLANHDKNNFETFCYYVDNVKDKVTDELISLSDNWRDCYDLPLESILKSITDDEIDILVDLAGHTSNSRLEIFAAKPAPVQITWLGYINTTGLSAMDYRIVDPYSDPVGVSEMYHSEELLRLPNTQWCFNKPKQLIDVSPLPAITNNFITFGSFNRYSKLSEKILTLWTTLLNTIKESRLLIIDVPNGELETISSFFISHGIAQNRCEFYGRISIETFRNLHHKVDIALDAHPYSGGTTTCESLWMGVPTLTLAGETSISRSTSSLMQTIGLADWVAYSGDEYLENAIRHTNNLTKLAELRLALRDRLETSPIMNAVQFTYDLEKAYREAWLKKCSA